MPGESARLSNWVQFDDGECGVFDTVYEGIERGAIKKDRREVRVKTLTPSDVRTCQRGHVTSEYLTPFHSGATGGRQPAREES